jgi:hypothetical protein
MSLPANITPADVPAIEQARIAALLRIFDEVDTARKGGADKLATLKRLAALHHGDTIIALGGKQIALRLSYATLRRHYDRFKKDQRTWSLIRKNTTRGPECPRELIAELRRRCTGGGTLPGKSSAGRPTATSAINDLLNEWTRGLPVPGLGTWREWWQTQHPAAPLPAKAPRFPFHPKTLARHCPRRESAITAASNLGLAAALDYLVSVERDSSMLKPGEVYVCDDVRLDLLCIDSMTRRRSEVRAYVMMEWGTRRIVAYVMRAGNALNAGDVRAMIARGLSIAGIRPHPETTHIFLERGTCVLSAEDCAHIALLSGNRIKVHQTGMISAERWQGAGKDRPVGNFRGKAVLESFFRRLHIKLGGLPGQRGNRWEAQPRNLDFDGQNSRNRFKDSAMTYTERLADLDAHYDHRLRLDLNMLWDHELEQYFADAIKDLNATRGHGMQGFGTVTVFVNPQTGEMRELTDAERLALSLQTIEGKIVAHE